MAMSLVKGGNVSLTQDRPGLASIAVGLGWDTSAYSGPDFDLDASAILVDASGKALDQSSLIYYNNKASANNSVVLSGDNRTGAGSGDDETIIVNLDKVSPDVYHIVFPVSIYQAEKRRQNFGQVRNAYIRVVDQSTGAEMARYDLTEDASTDTAMVFGEVYRKDGNWKFRAIGQSSPGGLRGIAREFGLTF